MQLIYLTNLTNVPQLNCNSALECANLISRVQLISSKQSHLNNLIRHCPPLTRQQQSWRVRVAVWIGGWIGVCVTPEIEISVYTDRQIDTYRPHLCHFSSLVLTCAVQACFHWHTVRFFFFSPIVLLHRIACIYLRIAGLSSKRCSAGMLYLLRTCFTCC